MRFSVFCLEISVVSFHRHLPSRCKLVRKEVGQHGKRFQKEVGQDGNKVERHGKQDLDHGKQFRKVVEQHGNYFERHGKHTGKLARDAMNCQCVPNWARIEQSGGSLKVWVEQKQVTMLIILVMGQNTLLQGFLLAIMAFGRIWHQCRWHKGVMNGRHPRGRWGTGTCEGTSCGCERKQETCCSSGGCCPILTWRVIRQQASQLVRVGNCTGRTSCPHPGADG